MKEMTHKQIESKLTYLKSRQEALDARIEIFNGRIKRCIDGKNKLNDKIRSLQFDCNRIGHKGEPCSICGHVKNRL